MNAGADESAGHDAEKNGIDQINRLIRLIETLRGENGCPWDKKQTPESMAVYLIEETYELVDAIRSGSGRAVREELGDVLFHLLFLAHLYTETGLFDLQSAAAGIVQKMIRRHPHVFGDREAGSIPDIRKQWREIKKTEKDSKNSILDGVPAGLPALMRAYRISERAGGAGFDWDDVHGVMEKAEEEWGEFKEAVHKKDKGEITMELGDILFTLVNVARLARVHPETALAASTQKFCERFQHMEKQLATHGASVESVPREELERQWNEAKKQVK